MEQSSLFSQSSGIAPSDFATEGPGDCCFPTLIFHLPSPCSFMLQWEKLFLPFPTFIQEEPQQHELRQHLWESKAGSSQDPGSVSWPAVMDGGH